MSHFSCLKMISVFLVLTVIPCGKVFALENSFSERDRVQIEQILNECRSFTFENERVNLSHDGLEQGPAPFNPSHFLKKAHAELTRQSASLNGRHEGWKFLSEFGKTALSRIGITALSTLATLYCAPAVLGVSVATQLTTAQELAVLGAMMGDTLAAAWRSWEHCSVTPLEALRLMDSELRQHEQAQVDQLPDSWKEWVENNYAELNHLYSVRDYYQSEIAVARTRKLIFLRELFVFSLPFEPKDVSLGSPFFSALKEAEILQSVDLVLRELSGNEEELRVLVAQIRNHSSKNLDSNQGVPLQKYLRGPADIDKAAWVQRLGRALGVTVCHLSESDLASHEALFGKKWTDQEDPEAVLGRLGQCYLEAGSTHFILWIENLGDLFSSNPKGSEWEDFQLLIRRSHIIENLTKLLISDRRAILLEGIDLELDFSRVVVIGAGESSLEKNSRYLKLPELSLGSLSPVQKALDFRQVYEDSLRNLKASGVRPLVLLRVKLVFDRHLERIFEASLNLGPERSVREFLDEILTHLSLEMDSGLLPEDDRDSGIQKFFLNRGRETHPS